MRGEILLTQLQQLVLLQLFELGYRGAKGFFEADAEALFGGGDVQLQLARNRHDHVLAQFVLMAHRQAAHDRQRTGLDPNALQADFDNLRRRGLLAADPARLQATPLGLRFLNELLASFSN